MQYVSEPSQMAKSYLHVTSKIVPCFQLSNRGYVIRGTVSGDGNNFVFYFGIFESCFQEFKDRFCVMRARNILKSQDYGLVRTMFANEMSSYSETSRGFPSSPYVKCEANTSCYFQLFLDCFLQLWSITDDTDT